MSNLEEKKNIINGGDVLIKCLLQEDIKYLFGIPGGQFLNMYDAVYRWGREKGINTILFRHEQAAAHAADAYARVTNKPAICFGTVGPGALHLVPGVGTAWSDNIPVIAIVPQVNSKYADSFTLQGNLDQVTMFKPITKYQKSIRKLEEIPDAIHKIFREATGGRPQPVLLEIFEDAFLDEIEEEKILILPKDNYRSISKPAIDEHLIKESLKLLLSAEKPLIVSGGGVMRSAAWNELQEFAEYLQIPVITTVMGLGTISTKSNCLIGVTIGTNATMQAAGQADVILSLGCRFSYSMGHGQPPIWNPAQKMIQVDIDPSIIGRNKPISLGIVGDCKIYLEQMLQEVKKTKKIEKREWLEYLNQLRQTHIASTLKKASKDKIPILPERMIKDVFEFMDEDAILIGDGGDIVFFMAMQMDIHKPRAPLSTLIPVGMGHLGVTVPYGIGAKLAEPDKQVISISGDCSFMINIQDLETAVRLGLKNLIFVIGNNNAWGTIKSGQKLVCKKRYIDVDLPEFDYAVCAKGFGCYGEVVTDPTQLKSALIRAKSSNKPAVLDVKIAFDTPDGIKLLLSLGVL
ncbi:MAG: thiamine pyrophosphate-binding protein [Promethearchaeota archaeon]|nr:MAG: thiamine pyrophosphate-binding protein [Candidatus Lokiarchaeota archaeon]